MNKIIRNIIFIACIILFISTYSAIGLCAEKGCDRNVDAFLKCNDPIVMKYLSTLTDSDIGKVLNGVQLTDGRIKIRGYKFIGRAKGVAKGIHLYVFERKNLHYAYMWSDKNADELLLPKCPQSISFESAYVLSGDVYTYKYLQPGEGIVFTMCVNDSWLKLINKEQNE